MRHELHDLLGADELRLQAGHCRKCRAPYCHDAGCPAPDLIPDLNNLICSNSWRDALALLEVKNPFPEITGRICPALCEAACVRSVDNAAVPLRRIELSLAERGYAEGWITPIPSKARTGKQVAIIGSGPAGLSCVHYLNRRGHTVTVFEKETMPGGILYYGIPDFKLDKHWVARRIDLMQKEGIVFKNRVKIGTDILWIDVMRAFDAVVLATGAAGARDIKVPGRKLRGIHFAMDYLTQQNKLYNHEPIKKTQQIQVRGKKVIVIGGGDTGDDGVATASRQGAEEIFQVELMPPLPKARSAVVARVNTQLATRKWSTFTRRFVGKKGRVTGIETVEIEWGEDRWGRVTFCEKAGSATIIPCDIVFIAAGFISAGNEELFQGTGIELNQHGFVEVDAQHMTCHTGVFCAGDCIRGASLVIKAIASGSQTAECVARFLEK